VVGYHIGHYIQHRDKVPLLHMSQIKLSVENAFNAVVPRGPRDVTAKSRHVMKGQLHPFLQRTDGPERSHILCRVIFHLGGSEDPRYWEEGKSSTGRVDCDGCR
jgi:hypothetical protein